LIAAVIAAKTNFASTVHFRVRVMLAARIFFFVSVFNVRTSDAVHSRRFDFRAI
jgi:hypothetical protein